VIESGGWGFPAGIELVTLPARNEEAGMAEAVEHLASAALQERGRLAMVFSSLAASCRCCAENPLIPAVQISGTTSPMSKSVLLISAGVVASTLAFGPALTLSEQAERCHILRAPPELAVLSEGGAAVERPSPGASPHFGGHGQVIYGLEKHFLNHLPVFMGGVRWRPHNFQVIFEVEFLDEAAMDAYRADRQAHPGTLYTAVPERFDQDDLAVLDVGVPVEYASPDTQIFRGHFEKRDRVQSDPATDLNVRHVAYFREFIPDVKKLQTPHYLLHGVRGKIYAAKVISVPPDFIQIVSVELDTGDGSLPETFDEVLAAGIYLHLPDRTDDPETRLRPGESLECSVDTGTRMPVVSTHVRVVAELYCEMGELSAHVPGDQFNNPTDCPL
jgi:hypothetical protein